MMSPGFVCLCGGNMLFCGKVSIRVSCGLWYNRGVSKNGDGYKGFEILVIRDNSHPFYCIMDSEKQCISCRLLWQSGLPICCQKVPPHYRITDNLPSLYLWSLKSALKNILVRKGNFMLKFKLIISSHCYLRISFNSLDPLLMVTISMASFFIRYTIL